MGIRILILWMLIYMFGSTFGAAKIDFDMFGCSPVEFRIFNFWV